MAFEYEGCFWQIPVWSNPNFGKWQPHWPYPCKPTNTIVGCMEQLPDGRWMPVLPKGFDSADKTCICTDRLEGCIKYDAAGKAYPVLILPQYNSLQELKDACCNPFPCDRCPDDVLTPQFVRVTLSDVQTTQGICCASSYQHTFVEDVNGAYVCEQKPGYSPCTWQTEQLNFSYTIAFYYDDSCSDQRVSSTYSPIFYISVYLVYDPIDGWTKIRVVGPEGLEGSAHYTGDCRDTVTVPLTPATGNCPSEPNAYIRRLYGGTAKVEFNF